MRHSRQKPVVLLILDGFGYRREREYNAIAAADTPCLDKMLQEDLHTLLQASGESVGLPAGQMGNSEVGHLNLGAGRVVYQDFSRIERSMADGDFFTNPVLTETVNQAQRHDKALHIMGLLSPGGVHSHERQIHAAVEAAVRLGLKKIHVHAFLDGRDTPPKSAEASLQKMDEVLARHGIDGIASIIGRYYAMDRDRRWERTAEAYDLLTCGESIRQAELAVQALRDAYAAGERDEFVRAAAIYPRGGKPVVIEDGDALLFMNYRADRARQLTAAFCDEDFDGFERKLRPRLSAMATLTQYDARFSCPAIFPPLTLPNVLGACLARHGLKQLRIAETEKYAHVTFFFNGGIETPFAGEERELIPSPKVKTYDLKPEMSAVELTDKLTAAIVDGGYDCIICNYANADMVGHTGDFDAAKVAIETLDHCIGRVSEATKQSGGALLITADHGNAENMYNENTGQQHTAHTMEPVPFIYQGLPAAVCREDGALQDVAPTLLYLMGLEKPVEMTGHTLLRLEYDDHV